MKSLLLLSVALLPLVACTDSNEPDPRLGARGALLFGYSDATEQPVPATLSLGAPVEPIYLWSNTNKEYGGDPFFLGSGGQGEAYSTNPDVAIFPYPNDGTAQGIMAPKLLHAGTTSLVITKYPGGPEIDHIDITVE
jgi:hypothetical protein